MSRKLEDLRPEFRTKFESVLAACKAQGVDLLVTCTLRTLEEQTALYAKGRSLPGAKVTNAKAGKSAHNFGLAADVVVIVNGKPDWSGCDRGWKIYGSAVRQAGLEWAGDWTSFKELPHCQLPDWKSHI